MKKFSMFKILILIFCFTATDQLSKYLVSKFDVDFSIMKGFFGFHEQINYGAAFSLPIPNILLIIITVILILVCIYFGVKNLDFTKFSVQIVASIFLAGAFGNLIDRILYGGVIDFIDICIYPVFNVADIYLTVSVFYILLFYGRIKRS